MFSEEQIDRLGAFSLSSEHLLFRAHRHVVRKAGLLPPALAEILFVIAFATGLFGLCAVAAGTEGRLGAASLSVDLEQLLNRPGVYAASPIPLLRDYTFLAVIVLTALSYGHFAKQWRRIERLPRVLAEGGMLRTDIVPAEHFCRWFDELRQASCRLKWEIWSALLAIVLTLVLFVVALHNGIYPLIDQGHGVGLFHAHEWWARPENGWVGAAAYCLVVGLFFFATIRHTMMGGHMLLWLARVRRDVRTLGWDDWLGYTDVWDSCEEAIGELRGAIVDVFAAILLGACAAAAAVYVVALPPELVVLLIAYLVYNLLVFILPWVYFNRQLLRSRRLLQKDVLASLRDAMRNLDKDAIDRLWILHARIDELPARVIERLPVGGLIALYLIPLVGIIPAYHH